MLIALLWLTTSAHAAGVSERQNILRLLVNGDPAEQTAWASRYEHGEGVTRDFDTAIDLYCAAALSGHAPAQYSLGWLYANARGGKRNDALAAGWFSLAAKQGDDHAERMLTRLGDLAPLTQPTCPRQDTQGAVVSTREEVTFWVHELAAQYDLDADLVLAVIATESNFNPAATSPKDARGLMQLIPATARRFGVEDSYDPLQNLHGGMAYLQWLQKTFDGEIELMLAAYNAGEKAVAHYGGIPPYPETRGYVRKILSRLDNVTDVSMQPR